jgi:hypothetical protein
MGAASITLSASERVMQKTIENFILKKIKDELYKKG